eukprot:Hpha_TRINITY_DN15627_c3_g9::TRINITY_DN15627_c3_g9_i1::g.98651::m.98651
MLFEVNKAAVVLAAVLVGGVGLLIGVVSSSSCSIVLADCEDTVDDSLRKCYSAGSGMLESMSAMVMDGAVEDVQSRIRNYLQLPVTDAQMLAQYMSLFHPNISDNWAFVDSKVRPYMAAAMEIKADRGLARLELFGGGGMQRGLPLGETAFMLGVSSMAAVMQHDDSESSIENYWKRMGRHGQHFQVHQYEGMDDASTECPPHPSPVLAASGPSNEKGEIIPKGCYFRVKHEGGNKKCSDSIHLSRLCKRAGVCQCDEAMQRYGGCSGGGQLPGDNALPFRIEDLCMKSCDSCKEVHGACFQSQHGRLSARWESQGKQKVRFTVDAEVEDADKEWVGIGFSCTGHMPGADMVIATPKGVTDRYAKGNFEPTVDAQQDISDVISLVRDGSFSFSFTRSIQSVDANDNSISEPIHVLLASGPINASSGDLLYHSSRTFSRHKIDLTHSCGSPIHGSHSLPEPDPEDPLRNCRHWEGEYILGTAKVAFMKSFHYPVGEVRWAPVQHHEPGHYLLLSAYTAIGDPDDSRRRVGLVRAGVDIRALSL